MKYSVGLQSPFAFSAYWYIIGIAVLLLAFVLWHVFGMKININSPLRLDRLRRDSMRRISGIEQAYSKGEMGTRDVYQQMSREVRRYTQAVTGWRTMSMLPDEMQALAIPELGRLMQGYYQPEFDLASKADAWTAVADGREAVEAVHRFAVRQRRVSWRAAIRSRTAYVRYRITQMLPVRMRAGMAASSRKKAIRRIERIERKRLQGQPDPHFLYLNLRLEVRAFIRSVTGWPDDDTVIQRLRRKQKRKPFMADGKRYEPDKLAKDFYEPEFTCHSIDEVTLSIMKAKELISKWN